MAVTLTFLPMRPHYSWGSWLKEVAEWITGVHGTYAGPEWDIIEADDGTTREVPVGGTTASNLSAGNSWSTASGGIPAIGSWIVFQSRPGAIPPNNTFQLLFYIDTGLVVHAHMFVLSDFATGGASTGGAKPTLPVVDSSYTGMSRAYDGYLNYFAIADQSVLQLGISNPAAADDVNRWWYVGELDVPKLGGGLVTTVDYPFAIRNRDIPAADFLTETSSWKMRHPLDVNMELGPPDFRGRYSMEMPSTDVLTLSSTTTPVNADMAVEFHAYQITFDDFGAGAQGYLRHAFIYNANFGAYRFTVDKNYYLMSSQANPGIAVRWDGVTSLP